MALAQNLSDLLRIRNHRDNARFFRQLPGCLGTAVGFKYNEREGRFEEKDGKRIPAILVFVKEKIPYASLDPKWIVPERLTGPDGLECASDVMLGSTTRWPRVADSLSPLNERIRHELHERDLGVVGGIPIDAPTSSGTVGCVVRIRSGSSAGTRSGRSLGVLTNYHVAGFPGTRLVNAGGRASVLGNTTRSIPYAPRTRSTGDLEGYLHGARHRVDLGLVALTEESVRQARPGVHAIRPLGRPYELDLETMGPIGLGVVGVGQARARQQGRIMAYGYTWCEDPGNALWCATDYLILGDSAEPFAAPGDSGKLVVTDEENPRPIALLWGGERHNYWNVPAQASCAYATDIGLALDLLDASIL